jgi:hypothetical protein
MKRFVYIVGSGVVITILVMEVALSLKQSACDGVLNTIPEGVVYTGPCAFDGNGFASIALGVFVVALLLAAINLWIVKRFKL